MVVVEAAVLAGVLGLVIYAVTSLLVRTLGHPSLPGPPRPPLPQQVRGPWTAPPPGVLPGPHPGVPGVPPGSSLPGRWRVAHYDAQGRTHVVLRRITADHRVLDEHVVASLRSDDPEYDDRFLAAMSTARQRQALFEAEEHEG